MSRQLHCRDMCKIFLRSVAHILNYITKNFDQISNSIEIALVGLGPDAEPEAGKLPADPIGISSLLISQHPLALPASYWWTLGVGVTKPISSGLLCPQLFSIVI